MSVELKAGEYHRRTDCRVCRSERLESFLDYGPVPLAGNFLLPEQVGQERLYPMDLTFCPDCALTQISNVVSAEVIFSDYRYLSSITKTLTGHFQDYAKKLRQEYFADGSGLLVEFGCNDGVLLSPLAESGVQAVGVDAAENVVEIAKAKGLDVRHGFFGGELGAALRKELGKATVITSSNCFAHIDDLDNVLQGVDALLDANGTFIVEVHYVLDLLELVQFETVYHEHLCYYSLKSLETLYDRFGLELVDVERLPMHGGAIRVFAKRKSANALPSDRLQAALAREQAAGVYDSATYQKLGTETRQLREAIREFVLGRKAMGRTVSAYGAAGRATTLLNYCGLDASVIDYIVDESPSRVGRYVPGVQIPVLSRDHFHAHPTDDCLITAWNYRDEIVAKEPGFLQRGGAFLTPLPKLEVIQSDRACLASA